VCNQPPSAIGDQLPLNRKAFGVRNVPPSPAPPTQLYISQSCITHPSLQGLGDRKFGEYVRFQKNCDVFYFGLSGRLLTNDKKTTLLNDEAFSHKHIMCVRCRNLI
jgi:hypothetical protein